MSKHAPDLVLGTAGHIDHGKSSLVSALTGTDPDRLAEEKRRGITIELGFAQLTLPDDRTMSVVDVPGHERFVRQMIAGATGIDVALLVIAADDGIMPQTIEHLAVLQMLGIASLVVALTKTDLVDETWVAFVAEEIRSFLAHTPYPQAAIVACSSKTKVGLDELRLAISEACQSSTPVHAHDAMREPIDRVFSVKGAGTVVTGTLWSGSITTGDTVEVLPGGKKSRVRSVQQHDIPVEVARAGNRVALNLADLTTNDVRTGDVLVAPQSFSMTDRFDALFTYLDTAGTGKPFMSGTRVHIAHGTREVGGRVLFFDGITSATDQTNLFAQIRLDEPLALASGDRFIVRSWSPVRVIGGGRALIACPHRRTTLRPQERLILNALRDGNIQTAVEHACYLAPYPLTPDEIHRTLGLPSAIVKTCLENAADTNGIVSLKQEGAALYTTQSAVQKQITAIEQALLDFHATHPASVGITAEELRRLCAPRCASAAFSALIGRAARTGKACVLRGKIGHPHAQGTAQAALDEAAHKVLDLLEAAALAPPLAAEIPAAIHVAPALVKRALTELIHRQAIVKVGLDLFFSQSAIVAARETICTYLRQHTRASVADLRDALGTSRKYAVPLLEYFDAQGLTVRDGNIRLLA